MRQTHLHVNSAMTPARRLTAAVLCMALAAGVVTICGCLFGPPADVTDAARLAPVLSAPLRISPSGENVDGSLLQLVWSPVPRATHYVLYLGPDTNPPLMVSLETTQFLVRDLPPCMSHYWRVVAMNDDQFTSSPVWTFKTRCPAGSK